jgi:hypothetical protein
VRGDPLSGTSAAALSAICWGVVVELMSVSGLVQDQGHGALPSGVVCVFGAQMKGFVGSMAYGVMERSYRQYTRVLKPVQTLA